jgi:hypothetical protein
MSSPLRFSDLSHARQTLLRLCQSINHGSIENLRVEHAEPIFEPAPAVLKDVKLDSDEGTRPELSLENFVVGDEAGRLMNHLDEMDRGILRRVEVRAGIPRRIVIESLIERPRTALK